MAPRLVSGGLRRRRFELKELLARDDVSDSESDDGLDSDSDDDSDDEDAQPNATAPAAPTTQTGLPAPPGTGTQTAITTPAITPPSVQAGAVNPSDPNGVLTRVSEDGLHTGGRIGVAVGVVAGVILLFGLTYFIWGRKRRSRQRAEHGSTPSVDNLIANNKPPDPRTNTQILDELMATAYGDVNGKDVADEKRQSDYPYHKAKMRPSMASWLRRHHPLQLNSLSRWSSSTGKTRSSTATSVPSNRNTTTSFASRPGDEVPAVPPVPALPSKLRFSERFKSVWSDTSAGTAETESDAGKSRGYGSILVGYQHSEWDPTEKKAGAVLEQQPRR